MFSDNNELVVCNREIFECYVDTREYLSTWHRAYTSTYVNFLLVFHRKNKEYLMDCSRSSIFTFDSVSIENNIHDICTKEWSTYCEPFDVGEFVRIVKIVYPFDDNTAFEFLKLDTFKADCFILNNTLNVIF